MDSPENQSSPETKPDHLSLEDHSYHPSDAVSTDFDELYTNQPLTQPSEPASLSAETPAEDTEQSAQTENVTEFSENLALASPAVDPTSGNLSNQVSESGHVVEQAVERRIDRNSARARRRNVVLPMPMLTGRPRSKVDELREQIERILDNCKQGVHSGRSLSMDFIERAEQTRLGNGAFGTVYRLTAEEGSNVPLALKRVSFQTKEEPLLAMHAELSALDKIRQAGNSPYIVDFYGALMDYEKGQVCIGFELMATSMEKFYREMHDLLDSTLEDIELVVRRCSHDVIRALHFLEMHHIVHRDVKPANLLINDGRIKLCDLGISGDLADDRYDFPHAVGTLTYLPPTLEQRAIQSDMWALGVTLLEMILGRHPITQRSDEGASLEIQDWEPTIPEAVSDDLRGLLQQLLQKDSRRPPRSYKEIIDNTFIGTMPEEPSDAERDFASLVIDRITSREATDSRTLAQADSVRTVAMLH